MKNQCLSKLFTFFIFVLLTTSSGVYAQPIRLNFKHITKKDGLLSSSVLSVVQDYKGIMWFGTIEGLCRYDGTNFIKYNTLPSDPTSLDGFYIKTILEDHNKNLLIGTDNGLSQYNRDLDCFLNYKFDKSSALYNKQLNIRKITEDSIGNLWIATAQGLIYFDRKNNKIIQYLHDLNNPNNISDNNVEYVYVDSRGRVWVSTWNGLDLFNRDTGKFEKITYSGINNINNAETIFNGIIEDREGNIWFGSNDGLYCLENKNIKGNINLINYKNIPGDPNSISINRIKSLFIDSNNNFWIGTENGGLNLFDRDKKQFIHYRMDEFNPMSLNNESIQAITQDRVGNIWVCTFGGEVNVTFKGNDFITHYKNLPGAAQSLSPSTVSCFLEDRYDRKWVGTDGSGVNLFDENTGRFKRYNDQNSGLKSNAILCMEEGAGNQIWMGTWAGGLASYNYDTNTFKSLTTQNSSIPDNSIMAIEKDNKGNLWLGSFRNGLIYYKIKENKFISFTPENSQIGNYRITVIKMDRKGQLYLGITSGLQIFNPQTEQFITYTESDENYSDKKKYLSNTGIYDVLIGNDTCVWLATHNGLNRYNPVTGYFYKYFKEDGLPDNAISGVTLDKSGKLWITTNYGICWFDYANNKFKNFTASDGIQGNEFSARCILTTNTGAILAGGENGFNVISPEKFSENKNIPEVVITDFFISHEHVKIGTKDSPLTKQISETKEITLTYKQSVLTFYFSVIDFAAPEKNQYAYKMDGFDDKWIYSGNRREATYTNLNPGEYVLHVKGSNNDGIWNEKGVSLSITILPPWWKTLWFRVLILFLLLVAIYFAYYLKVASYRNKQKELSELVKKRTSEITQANKELLERQTLIENQSEELRVHSENLTEANELLIQKQTVIKSQSDEILEANTELVKLNKTKDRILSIIAHDLRNPFNVVSGFSEILLEEYRDLPLETIEMYLPLISNASKNGNILLGNLLQWSRTQTGSITFEPVPLKLRLVAEETYNFLEGDALKKNISVLLKIDSALEIVADENMVKTILRNLLSNAIKFTRDKGTILVTAILSSGQAEICVSDSGVGIPEEKIPLLFRIETNKSTKGTSQESGSGLGLILCREFVEKHGGQIWVESELGKGSDFKFTIPLPT